MKRYLLALLMLSALSGSFAQDPTFTQFYANPLYLNPAFAGSHGCPRFALNYRNEWPSLTGNYVTYSASYDQYFKN
ncbi:MAG: type IX secretion system membrane protein PorP/SprF, partial [Bacteroidota bacterium]